jgi:hypothetical protein
MGCRSASELTTDRSGSITSVLSLIKGIDTPNGKAHFVVARETPINADMRVSRQWESVVEVHFFSAPTSRQFTATGH